MGQVPFTGLDSNQCGEGIELRSKSQAWVDTHMCHLNLLLPHDTKLIVVGGHALVNDSHEDGKHHGEHASQEHVEACEEEGDLGPGLSVTTHHFLLFWMPDKIEYIVQLVCEAKAILDDHLLLVD